MREFYSEKEKEVIDYLVENFSNRIESNALIIHFMDAVALELFAPKSKEFMIISKDNECQLNEKGALTKAERSFVDLIILLQGLEEDNLIKIVDFKSKNEKPVHRLYDPKKYRCHHLEEDDPAKVRTSKFIDNVIAKNGGYLEIVKLEDGRIMGVPLKGLISSGKGYLYDYIWRVVNKVVFPCPELIDLKNNGYKTPTQRRFEEEQRSTKCSIRIALIVGMCSILSIIISFFIKTRINDQQLKSLLYSIESTSPLQRVDARVINDTLNVNVTNEKLISGNPEKQENQ